jgi:TonB-linked SusC/RagA family outer membrane protein
MGPPQQQPQDSIVGVVVDAASGRPVPGAQVQIVGSTRGASTDADGRFRITGVPARTAPIRVTRLGYKPVTVTPSAGAPVRVALDIVAQGLEQVVVTATGEQRLKEMGSAVERLKVDSVLQTAASTNVVEAISARVAGVYIKTTSGSSIGGARIRIRGSSSRSLANEPIVYVDGVRINTDPQALAWSANQQMPSRFDDIDPDQIENIVVLKGPSASTMYGTEAANGVILITTKSGSAATRRAEWRAWTETGRITEPNKYPANYSGKDATGRVCLLTSVAANQCVQAKVDSFNLLMDKSTTPFHTGNRGVLGTSVSGAAGDYKYYVSADYQNEVGIYQPVDGITKRNVRGNFSLQPTSGVQIQLNTGYLNSLARIFADGGTVLGFVTNGLVGGACNTCWSNYSPDKLAQVDAKQRVDRYIGGLVANVQPTAHFQLRGQLGWDALSQQDDRLIPVGVLVARNPTGERTVGKTNGLNYNADLLARIEVPLRSNINSTTSIGGQYLGNKATNVTSLGTSLVPGTNSLSAAGLITTTERTTEIRTIGGYFEQQISINDRLFLTGGLRTDNNSSFGKSFKKIVYPKLGASWVLSDESFYPAAIPTSSLRARFAWGRSGSQPGPLNSVTYYGTFPMTLPDGSTASGVSFQGGNLGNPGLKPEGITELEGGVDVGFLKDRVTLALTSYKKTTADALVNRSVASSLGAATGRWENLSKVENSGWEGLLSATLFERKNVSASIVANGSINHNKLLVSGTPAVNGSSFTEGYPLGAYWARNIISYNDANNDGIIASNELVVTDTMVYIGEVTPPYMGTLQPTLTLFNRFRTTAVLYRASGVMLDNMGERMRCQGGQARPRSVKTSLDEQAACVAYALLGVNGGLIQNASFTKLRELSFTYDVPERWLTRGRLRRASVTLAGQNLKLWTKYGGIDPDVSSRGTNFQSQDYLQPGNRRVWLLRANLNF